MTKKDIVRSIAKQMSLSQGLVYKVVQRTLAAITEALVREQHLELRDFGVFEVRIRAPRRARNPRTNQWVNVPSRAVVAFRPAGR